MLLLWFNHNHYANHNLIITVTYTLPRVLETYSTIFCHDLKLTCYTSLTFN